MVSCHDSGWGASSCTWGIFFQLHFCKSGSLKTYMYMCIKCMYIKIMLFKYLHIKPRDWLPSQNYWNYLPQEHLDLKNLYSNTFLQKLNNLWGTSSAPFAVHIGSVVWGDRMREGRDSHAWAIHFQLIMTRCSFIALSIHSFLLIYFERIFTKKYVAQWGFFFHCSRTGPCNGVHLGHI